MKWLALDIGGANVKAADGQGYAQSCLFHLWKNPSQLAQQIRTLLSEAPPSDHLAITMTGELADCFESKEAGVKFILKAVGDGSDNRHTRVYLNDGRLVTPQVALTMPALVAASNWHAIAKFAGRYAKTGSALVIDVGSTTCDIIPLVDGEPKAIGKTDTERLLSGELVYTGVERSPVCAVADKGPYRGRACPLVHEVFATMRDVYTLLDELPEDASSFATADGKPATKAYSRVRLGRMVAADGEEFNHRDAIELAKALANAQSAKLAVAVQTVKDRLQKPPSTIVLSGHGEFLARDVLATLDMQNTNIVSLSRELGSLISRCAPAHAVAVLTREATTR
jgi:probable H4MPT-linked C1 transfer pathway protein